MYEIQVMSIEELSRPPTVIELGQLSAAAQKTDACLSNAGLRVLRRLMFAYDAMKGQTISDLIRESHATAVEKGWWEKDRSFPEGIALMHSELSEALEYWRHFGMKHVGVIDCTGEGGKPEGIAAEFADVMIRIFDWCGKYDIPLEEALRAKMTYNKTRSHRHGGKLA